MAAQFISSSVNTGTVQTVTVATPSGSQANDLLVIVIAFEKGSQVSQTNNVTGGTGTWARILNTNDTTNYGMQSHYKVLTAGENSTYSFDAGTSGKFLVRCILIRGADTTTPINISGGQSAASGTAVTAPSVTTTAANCYVMAVYTLKVNSSFTPVAGTTERFDSSGNDNTLMMADFEQAVAGATSARTATAATSAAWAAQQIAINEGGGGGGNTVIKTWNLRQINVGGTNPNRLWWDEDTAVAAATSATGWTVGTLAPTRYALMSQGLELTTAAFSTTVAPDATAPAVDNSYAATAIFTPPTLLNDIQSISTLYEYNGYFPAGNWTFSFPVIAVSAGGNQDGGISMRVFKGQRSGTAWANVTELTTAVLVGTNVTNLATTTPQTSTVTWSAPDFFLNNEFLICKIAWRITGAGSTNTRDVLFRYGSGATMITPGFRKRLYKVVNS
jgi:hypothetical protein